jgi:Neuraminidase (sialidase)
LDISLIDRPWETTNLTGNGNATVADDDPDNDNDVRIAQGLNNEQVCAIQKEGVDYKTIEKYYTVFEVLFFQSMDVRVTKRSFRLFAKCARVDRYSPTGSSR